MTVEKWVDYSKYQGRVGEDKLRRMVADGVKGVCVGSWHGLDENPYAKCNLRDARLLGLKTATYIVVNNRPGYWTVRQGWEACGAEWDYLSFVAADVEVRGVTEAILGEALATIEAYGGQPCIYTGNWFWNWWKLDLGHVPDFHAWPTWLALYNGVPDLNVTPAYGLGPVVGHQYTGSTAAYGTTVDFNVFDSKWIGGDMADIETLERRFVERKIYLAHVARVEAAARLLADKGSKATAINQMDAVEECLEHLQIDLDSGRAAP